jgi:hypothetical protein
MLPGRLDFFSKQRQELLYSTLRSDWLGAHATFYKINIAGLLLKGQSGPGIKEIIDFNRALKIRIR